MLTIWLALTGCGATEPAPELVVGDDPGCTDPASCTAMCDAGGALACNHLGLWLHDGLHGAPRDPVAASKRYGQACELRAGIGCYNLAHMKAGGQGIPADSTGAEELLLETRAHYQASCDAGGLTWCTNLAGLMQRGEGLPPSAEAARSLYDSTCERGDPLACLELAGMLQDGEGGGRDPEAAEALLRRMCDGGSEEACNNLALTVEARGDDPLPIFQQACDRGVPVACRNIAVRVRDPAVALPLLEKACDAPIDLDGVACVLAGQLLAGQPGQGDRAITYLSRACSVGLAEACVEAVRLGASGVGTLPPERGLELLQRGCGLGFADACVLIEQVTQTP